MPPTEGAGGEPCPSCWYIRFEGFVLYAKLIYFCKKKYELGNLLKSIFWSCLSSPLSARLWARLRKPPEDCSRVVLCHPLEVREI